MLVCTAGLRIMKRWAVIVRHYALRLISSFLPFFLSDLSLTHVFVLSSFVVFPVHLLSLVSEPTAIIRSLSSQMEVTVWWPFSSKGSSDSGSDRVRGLYRKYYDPDMTETFNSEVLILLCCLFLHSFPSMSFLFQLTPSPDEEEKSLYPLMLECVNRAEPGRGTACTAQRSCSRWSWVIDLLLSSIFHHLENKPGLSYCKLLSPGGNYDWFASRLALCSAALWRSRAAADETHKRLSRRKTPESLLVFLHVEYAESSSLIITPTLWSHNIN